MSRNQSLKDRARIAYRCRATRLGRPVLEPAKIEEVEHDDRRYIVLANVNEVLAVYSVHTVKGELVLKGLKSWPAEVTKAFK